MKDRQFTVILALVVAAGLVMGLVAFRMTGVAPSASTAAGASGAAPSNAPRPSAADEQVAEQPDADGSLSTDAAGSQNGEPSRVTVEPPELQGPADGDPPGTAAADPGPPPPQAGTADSLQ